jgi:hypothetical protein
MNKRLLIFFASFLILLASTYANAQSIPSNIWEFSQDYYDVIGEPLLSASIVGNPEYESGETSTIFIQLMNDGLIYGFDTKQTPVGTDETKDARKELDLEYDVNTAINIRSILISSNKTPIRVISGLAHGGSLRSGEISQPIEFDIEIYKNAQPGTYELVLNLTYQYQYDVKVEGYPDQKIDYLYVTKNQTSPINIVIKPKSFFEITNVISRLIPGEQSILSITYKNIGSETANDAVARISVVDPFSTNDDQAFLGTLKPNESYQAQFTITMDDDALPKTYGINTEVKYRDKHGGIRISDVMKASVQAFEPVPLSEKIGTVGYIMIIVVVLGVIGLFIYSKSGPS